MNAGVDIPLHRIEATVCDLCLSGAGGTCHVPGCSFCRQDAPTGDTLRWVQGVRELTSVLEENGPAERLASAVEDFVFTTTGSCEQLREAWQSYVETVDGASSSRTNGDQETPA